MEKQLFYIIAIVILMIIVHRLMKKVKDVPTEDPYKIRERPDKDYDGLDDDLEDELSEEDDLEEEDDLGKGDQEEEK